MQGKNRDSKIKWISQYYLQAYNGVKFFLMNSPVLFILIYMSANARQLANTKQKSNWFINCVWKSDIVLKFSTIPAKMSLSGEGASPTLGLQKPILILLCISLVLWTKWVVFLIWNTLCFVFCDYFILFLEFPKLTLNDSKGFPSNYSEKLGLLYVGQDSHISALKYHKW